MEAGRGCLYAGEALRDGRGSAPPDAFVHVEFIFNYCITGTVAPDSSGHASTVIDGGKKGQFGTYYKPRQSTRQGFLVDGADLIPSCLD